jgi:DNA/RNA-binding domain of Phe-tRNA-synthetase-like protein
MNKEINMDIQTTPAWQEAFPGGHVGALLLSNIDNTGRGSELEECKRSLETRLRAEFGRLSRAELLELEVLNAYRAYYRGFDQTYHVQLQLESVVHKNKALPNVNPLVDASFLAELETLVLTASHDADRLVWPLTIDVTQGGEAFEQVNGKVRSLKARDMMMADAQGTVCTILYGQDRRTPVSTATRRVLYVCYAPPGVTEKRVRQQLDTTLSHVRLFASEVQVEGLKMLTGGVAP